MVRVETMIHAVGIDIANSARIGALYARYGGRALEKICSRREIEVAPARGSDTARWLTGRFAAKEAVMKALGWFFESGVALTDIEILEQAQGNPTVQLPEPLRRGLAGKKITLSISLDHSFALATAMITDED